MGWLEEHPAPTPSVLVIGTLQEPNKNPIQNDISIVISMKMIKKKMAACTSNASLYTNIKNL